MARETGKPLPSTTPTGLDVERDIGNDWDDTARGGGRRVIAAGKLTGDRVRNPADEDLGKIEDIMIDISTGRIAYAVLSFGGFLGMGNKLFAIPWQALSLNQRDHEFVLNVEKQRLETAPGFDKNHWPDMADREWGAQVFAYYGYKPYWEGSAPLESRKENTRMAQRQNRLVCDGCGKQFSDREDLERHRAECPAVQSQSKASGKIRAMGSTRPPDDIDEG